MKRKSLFFAVILLAISATFLFASCGVNPASTDIFYTVTFDTMGGDPLEPVSVKAGETFEPQTPTRTNYTFDSWWLDEGLTQRFYATTPVNGNITLHAKWTPVTYRVTLVLPEEQTVAHDVQAGDSLDLGTLTDYDSTKWLCKGWTDGTKEWPADGVVEVNGDITLTGEFEFLPFVYYLDESGEFYSIGGNNGLEAEVEIPAQFNGLPVKEILYMGYSDTLTSLTVPDTIDRIEKTAFGDLVALESLDVPWMGETCPDYDAPSGDHSLGFWFYDIGTHIADDHYYDGLRHYHLPEGHYDPNNAEAYQSTYREVLIPVTLKNVTVRGGAIMDYSFSNMAMLQTVKIGDGITHIAAKAFWTDGNASPVTGLPAWEPSLTVEFGEASELSYLGYGAFDGNVALVSIEIPKGVKELPGRAFADCTNLTDITFADGSELQKIGDSAFYFDANSEEKPSLTHIDLPETLQSIGAFAFNNLISLESIVIPAAVNELGAVAFGGCKSLTSATFADGSAITEIPSRFFELCLVLSDLSIPSTVTTVGEDAFNNCKALETFDFTHITSIGAGAFNACRFTALVIPANVAEVGSGAFENNDYLTSVTFQNSLEELNATFDDCDSLSEIVFPQGLKTIGSATFRNCKSLTQIVIPATVETIGDHAFSGLHTSLASLTFASGSVLKSIGEQAFRSQVMTELVFPASLESVGREAFAFCYDVTSVTFGGTNLKDIGEGAFRRMTSLSEFSIPDGTVNIGKDAFEDDAALSEITIPKSVKTIGSNAFGGCPDLMIVLLFENAAEYGEASAQWAADWNGSTPFSYANGSSNEPIGEYFKGLYYEEHGVVYVMEYIGEEQTLELKDTMNYNGKELEVRYHRGLFKNNKKLVTVTLPATMTAVPEEFFSGCTSLATVNATKLTVIGAHAFDGCTSLKTVAGDLTALEEVNTYGFNNCQNLTIDSLVLTPALKTLGERAFYNCKKINIVVGTDGFDSLSEIGASAFYYVPVKGDDNKVLTIPGNVKKIGDRAFNMSRPANTATAALIEVIVFEEGVDYIGDQAFANMAFSTRFFLKYFLFKGTPSYIGSGFAEGNFSGKEKHTFKSRIYFEKAEFEQGLLVDGYLDGYDIVLPWGKLTSSDESAAGWASTWYYYTTDDEAEDGDLYMPVFGKGQWTYGEDGVPQHHVKPQHVGVYQGTDTLFNDWGDFLFTITEDKISIIFTDKNGEFGEEGGKIELDVTITFAFDDGYILEIDGEVLYVYFQFDESGKVTAGIFVSHYYFHDAWWEEDEYPDGVHVEFHPVTE